MLRGGIRAQGPSAEGDRTTATLRPRQDPPPPLSKAHDSLCPCTLVVVNFSAPPSQHLGPVSATKALPCVVPAAPLFQPCQESKRAFSLHIFPQNAALVHQRTQIHFSTAQGRIQNNRGPSRRAPGPQDSTQRQPWRLLGPSQPHCSLPYSQMSVKAALKIGQPL